MSQRDKLICSRYSAGESPNEIGAEMGLTGARIRQILRAGGVLVSRFRPANMPLPLPGEEWRAVDGWPYQVSNLGRVRRVTAYLNSSPDGVVALSRCSGGYPGCSLAEGGRKKTALVHDLIAKAFLGPRPSPRHVVAHGDGNPMNSVLENLRWATYEENEDDKRRHGRLMCGTRNPKAKICDVIVRAIRGSSAPLTEIAAQFGISKATASKVRRRDAWKHVA